MNDTRPTVTVKVELLQALSDIADGALCSSDEREEHAALNYLRTRLDELVELAA